MPALPAIAIVGRPNVGKSSLLNALVHKRISIVQDMPGVTRDRIAMPIRFGEHWVELVDTGGWGFDDPDQLTEHIRHQIELALASARVVLFIVDCQEGLTSADEEVASLLRKKGLKTIIAANKADGPGADAMLGDFARLGLGTPIGVSAMTGRNLDSLGDALADAADWTDGPLTLPPPELMVAIVGKRNAGKSTLVNSVAELYEGHGDRVIVSEIPGTTRDSVDVRFEKDGHALVVIDTAGVRKKRQMVKNDIQFYSFHRAERSIRRADVVLMLIDAAEPVSEPDQKLAQYIARQFKPVIIVMNKWDTARSIVAQQDSEAQGEAAAIDDSGLIEKFRKYLAEELKELNFAPVAFITAKDGRNIQALIDSAQRLFKQANERVGTGRLNAVIRQILETQRPSTPSGRKARIYYGTQIEINPPTIVLFVNNPLYFDDSYQRFMINRFREMLPYREVLIKLVIRARIRGAKLAGAEELPEDLTDPDVRPRPIAKRSSPPTKAPTRRVGQTARKANKTKR
jgi:GTP-binding protein